MGGIILFMDKPVQVGDFCNFIRLYQAIDQAGQLVKLDIYEGMPHVFQPTLPNTSESKAAMRKVSEFVKKHLIDE